MQPSACQSIEDVFCLSAIHIEKINENVAGNDSLS